jgi:hypothetical protein
MSRIIHVNFHDHNDLARIDQQIAIALSKKESVGKTRVYLEGQRNHYIWEHKITVIPSLVEMSQKYPALRQITFRLKDTDTLLEKLDLRLLFLYKEKDRILGKYPEDKY